MSFNIELKARCSNLELFEQKVLQLPHTFDGLDRQTDTFYMVPKGHLKLRESSLYGNFLIPYLRPDQDGPKRSDYSLLAVTDLAATKHLLEEMFGILLSVKKVRKIYRYENVRIHLDQVEKLGDFIEFEAVIEEEAEIFASQRKLHKLIRYFELKEDALIAKAYADLLLKQNS